MKDSIKFFVLIFLIVPAIVQGQDKKSVLWEISRKGLTKKSYILGTFHIASNTIIKDFPQLGRLIKESDFGLFEIKGDEIGKLNQQSEDTSLPEPPLDRIFTL